MKYNFKSPQDEVLYFLHLRINELTKENEQLKEELYGQ